MFDFCFYFNFNSLHHRTCSRWWCPGQTWTRPRLCPEATEAQQRASFPPAPSRVGSAPCWHVVYFTWLISRLSRLQTSRRRLAASLECSSLFWRITPGWIHRLTALTTTPGSVSSRDPSAEREQQPSLTGYSCSSNVTSSVPLSFSGPAVRYNAEFTKRIPVTGLGGFSNQIISLYYGLLSRSLQ